MLNAYIFKEWDFVRSTRKYVGDLILGIYKDQLYAEKVATAASELIENAYKYSPTDTDFNIVLERNDSAVTIQVRNYVVGDSSKVLQLLHKEIELVWSDPDPAEAFKKKMIASLTDSEGKSMLGYAKIRLETGASLQVELEEQQLLLVTAVFPTK
ncbi:MAG: hypothetical protein A2Z96_07090 [Spirochaetes bacterium GWB1_48_6]|nr:MAG: hypothetical protein A2Z96_07090 [Spirochaetes bacterium GWB1_48_6]